MSKFWFIWPLTCYKVRAPILCYYEIHTTDVENEIFTVGQRKYPSYLFETMASETPIVVTNCIRYCNV